MDRGTFLAIESDRIREGFKQALKEDFGLNDYESKIYSALVFHGPMDAPIISEESGVPLQRVYQSLRSLIQKGFVIRTGSKLKTFAAQNPRSILSRKYQKIREIIAKSEEAYEATLFHPESRSKGLIWNLERTEDILSTLADLIKTARKIVVGTSHDFSWLNQMDMKADIEGALKRGVKIRGIGFADPALYPDIIQELKGENFQVKRYHEKELPIFVTTDSSELVLAIQKPNADLRAHYLGVWIRDSTWGRFFEECFHHYWQESQES